MQNVQEWIELIKPWNDIQNIGYTSRRIDQKMQVRNTYLDSDKAESTDMIQEPQWSWELQAITHFTHKVLWKNDFGARNWDWLYIPSDWTYMIKCSFTYMPVDQYDEVTVAIIKNKTVDDFNYQTDVILEISFVAPMGYPAYTMSEQEVVNLSKWDILNIGAYVGTNNPYPFQSWTVVDIIKLS